MSNPVVSIIIPTYNRAHYISETLDSILAQSFSNWECIIIDDGSNDNTVDILKKYLKDNRFTYHKRTSNYRPGGNGARNMGFDLSHGKYIKWFDSDDLMHPELLNLQLKEIEKHDYDFISCNLVVFENDKNNTKEKATKQFNNTNLNLSYPALEMLNGNLKLQTNCPLWDKKFLKGKILFDERIRKAQEADFNFRLLLNSQSQSFNYLKKPLVYLRREKNEGKIKSKKLTTDPKIITSIFLYYENVFKDVSKIKRDNIHYKVKDKMLNYAVYRMMFQYTKLRLLNKKDSKALLEKTKDYIKKSPLGFSLKKRLQWGLNIFHFTKKGHKIIHVKSLSLK